MKQALSDVLDLGGCKEKLLEIENNFFNFDKNMYYHISIMVKPSHKSNFILSLRMYYDLN